MSPTVCLHVNARMLMPHAPMVMSILAVAGESKIVLNSWKLAQNAASRYQQRSTAEGAALSRERERDPCGSE